ncbi:MAG: DAK2 domain-containing protein [Anaerolineae bacterium]|nr:DAK2 domain-containing protein [Thermoflexales bacterium]MDW8406721.1 DAK2 domain-containing protein [Anaerolineae bacterium]
MISAEQVMAAMQRVSERLVALKDDLNRLDAAMGDGDLGLSMSKGGEALLTLMRDTPLRDGDDIGKYLASAGAAFNRAAPSTMGTLLATALMRMGKEAKGATSLDASLLSRMIAAADQGIQERGKAKPGDKTIVDALHPAAEAFAAAIAGGASLEEAGAAMLAAAERGRDAAIALRSNIGRASWVGERTVNQLDPGTVLCVEILKSLTQGG